MPVPLQNILPEWNGRFQETFIDGILQQVFIPLNDFILSIEEDRNTQLTLSHLPRLQNRLDTLLNRYFMGPSGKPFVADLPQSSFAIAFADAYANVIYETFLAFQFWAEKYLPEDWLKTWRAMDTRPLVMQKPEALAEDMREKAGKIRSGQLRELHPQDMSVKENSTASFDSVERLFQPNPLADIDPERRWVHTWYPREIIDAYGNARPYRLSDSIWNAAQHARNDIDRILREGIQQGLSAIELSESLERYLLPHAATWRTYMPYFDVNTQSRYNPNPFDAPFSTAAMRLVRTELSFALNQAAYTAAATNPFVTGYDWILSNRHPKTDICDTFATMQGNSRLRPSMPMRLAVTPPAHPYCLCVGAPDLPEGQAALDTRLNSINEELRAIERNVFLPRMRGSLDEATELVMDVFGEAMRQFLPVDLPGGLPRRVITPF